MFMRYSIWFLREDSRVILRCTVCLIATSTLFCLLQLRYLSLQLPPSLQLQSLQLHFILSNCVSLGKVFAILCSFLAVPAIIRGIKRFISPLQLFNPSFIPLPDNPTQKNYPQLLHQW
jgi:hypothetical protein